MVIPLGVVGSHSLIRQDFMVLMSVRKTISLSMSTTSMSEKDIDGTTATATETKVRWCRRGTLLSATSKISAAGFGWTNLLQLAIGLNRSRQLVLGLNCTDYLERQVYLASRGERTVRVVLTTLFAPLGRPSSLIIPTGGRASRPRCTKGLRLCNPFTNVPSVRLTMALHQQRVRLVVLLDETEHIHHQLGAGLPAVLRGLVPPPLDEVTRP